MKFLNNILIDIINLKIGLDSWYSYPLRPEKSGFENLEWNLADCTNFTRKNNWDFVLLVKNNHKFYFAMKFLHFYTGSSVIN